MADDITRSPEEGGRIVEEPIGEALARRYLAYALSTITSRALPDVARRRSPCTGACFLRDAAAQPHR
ncbi:MAG: hypothetical protein R3C16_00685 [Hyphomonadaceae bacterium]